MSDRTVGNAMAVYLILFVGFILMATVLIGRSTERASKTEPDIEHTLARLHQLGK
jgi:hypothetical protein